jgi:iron complex outermembrane receptor protein
LSGTTSAISTSATRSTAPTASGLGPQADQQQHLDVELLSEELRFASPDDQPVRWIVGAFYINTKRDLETIGRLLIPGIPPIPVISSKESNDNDAYSVFGQVDWDFTDRTTLDVSLRYDRDEREQTDVSTGTTAVQDQPFAAGRLSLDSRTTSWVT